MVRPVVTGLGTAALVAGLAVPASAAAPATGSGGSGVATCPAAPARPAVSSAYALDGQRWNPAERIDWYYDTANVGATARPKRLADIKRALADAAAETHLSFVYEGEERTLRTSPPASTLQFAFVRSFSGTYAKSLGTQSSEYLRGGRIKQTVIGQVEALDTLATGYGAYDGAAPTRSAEGDVLLHEVGAVLGLSNVSASLPEVMSAKASTARYYAQYQAGDRYGLWKVGAAAGCSGFKE